MMMMIMMMMMMMMMVVVPMGWYLLARVDLLAVLGDQILAAIVYHTTSCAPLRCRRSTIRAFGIRWLFALGLAASFGWWRYGRLGLSGGGGCAVHALVMAVAVGSCFLCGPRGLADAGLQGRHGQPLVRSR